MPAPVLRIAGLSKTFPGTRALDDVSLDIRAGEIHALVGPERFGQVDADQVPGGLPPARPGRSRRLDGEAVRHSGHDGARPAALRPPGPRPRPRAQRASTTSRCTAGSRADAGRRVLWREQERRRTACWRRFGVELDIHRPLAEATPVERTVIAIAAALQGWERGGGVLVLDEPTAVLPADEVARLFAIVRGGPQVRARAVLYVSHRMDEIFQLADRVTVLRGGRLVTTRPDRRRPTRAGWRT